MKADLHCHTTASDGALSPKDLLTRAIDRGVTLLAITDHDTVDGYLALKDTAVPQSIKLIAGVELSSNWGRVGVHVVGLNINIADEVIQAGLKRQQRARQQRAEMIAQRLEKLGFKGGYEAAVANANGGQIGRPHFAHFLVEQGYASSIKQAFKRYLGAGKTADVKALWPTMKEVVNWIVSSGGTAVLAHPLHYKMTNTKLRALIADFKGAGGQSIEVVSGVQPNDRTLYLGDLAKCFDLYASCGSDFHRPENLWSDLGKMSPLPSHCEPVWLHW